MLDVHIRDYVDSGIQQDLHVLPSLGALRTRHIGVCQFIHNADGGPSPNDCAGIHLLKSDVPISNRFRGNQFQTYGLGNRIFSSMRLKVAHYDILSLAFELLCFFEHPKCLAYPRRIAKEHTQLRAAFGLRISDGLSAGGGRRRHRSLPRNE